MNQVCTDPDLVRQNLEVQIQESPKPQHNIRKMTTWHVMIEFF